MKRTILALQITAISLRTLSRLIRLWPFYLLVWFYLMEASPHVIMHHQKCIYLGMAGFQTPAHATGCPFLILLNTDTGELP